MTDVYVAAFPFNTDNAPIIPKERADEIAACKSEKQRREKFYVWKLLELGVRRSLGLSLGELRLEKAGGKWISKRCFFSLAHSGEAVIVAISDKPVGVDIELADYARFTEKLQRKILTEREQSAIEVLPSVEREKAACRLWTKKEAVFKLRGGLLFCPDKIETADAEIFTRTADVDGKEYVLSVAADREEAINIIVV